MTISEYLNQVKERCDAATKSPWQYDWNRDDMVQDRYGNPVVTDEFLMRGDQVFIAHARQDVEVLLEIVTKALEENGRLSSRLSIISGIYGKKLDTLCFTSLSDKLEALIPQGGE